MRIVQAKMLCKSFLSHRLSKLEVESIIRWEPQHFGINRLRGTQEAYTTVILAVLLMTWAYANLRPVI